MPGSYGRFEMLSSLKREPRKYMCASNVGTRRVAIGWNLAGRLDIQCLYSCTAASELPSTYLPSP